MSETENPHVRRLSNEEFKMLSDKEKIRWLIEIHNEHVADLKAQRQQIEQQKQKLNETESSLSEAQRTIEKIQAEKQQKKVENAAKGLGRRKTNSTGYARVRLSEVELSDILNSLEEYSAKFSFANKNNSIVQRLLALRRKIRANKERLWGFSYEIKDKGTLQKHVEVTKRDYAKQEETVSTPTL